jgi:predicted permease
MNGEPYTVVGIMPPRALIYGTDLWLPMPISPEQFPRNRRQFQILARLAPGVTLEQANAELATVAGRVAQVYGAEFEEYEGWRMIAMEWKDVNVRLLRPAAMILLGVVGFLLLLVVANVASLMLSRGWARNREIAVRAALGAGKRRILGQLLTESVMLALVGGVIGILLGALGVRAVSSLLGSLPLPIAGEVSMNGRVFGFTAVVSIAVGLAFGVVPALNAARFDLQRTLQAESQAVVGNRSRLRMQRVLVGVEVALALAILAGSALLVRSFLQLQRVNPGFDSSNVLTMRLTLAWERYNPAGLEPFFQELRERVSTIPGVVSVATTSQFPPLVFQQRQLQIEGREAAADAALPVAFTTLVSPSYFDVLRMQIVRGRSFTEADRAGSTTVMVINAEAASRYFPDQDPVGQRIRLGETGQWMEIVGVVSSAHNRAIDLDPAPEVYASTVQLPGLSNQMFLMVRTEREPLAVLPSVRQAVAAIDPQQPVYMIRTLDDAIAATQVTRRVSLTTLTLFAAFALILAGVGIYGVVANAVNQRTRELGLRMALGAAHGQVRRLVLRQALVPVTIGAAAGLIGAWALGKAMGSLLFGVGGSDPAALLGASALMAGTAFLATYVPARRASRLDPVRALKLE